MPSTVKVRIKGARNLASLAPATVTAAPSAPVRTGGASSPPVAPAAVPLAAPPTTHVSVTLGGHSAVAEYDEDDDPGSGDRGPVAGGRERGASVFAWQSKPGSSMEDDPHPSLAGGRTSRCYSARTRTVRRSARPVFNEEFRFEVADDTLLQDEVSVGVGCTDVISRKLHCQLLMETQSLNGIVLVLFLFRSRSSSTSGTRARDRPPAKATGASASCTST